MVFTPVEHSDIANKAIEFLSKQLDKYPKTSKQAETLKNASEVLSKAKEDIEYVNQCRNVLLAG